MTEFIRMEEKHLDEVCAIEAKSFSMPWSRQLFVNELNAPDRSFILTATENGEVAGYGGFWLIVDEIHIVTLAVKKEFRRKGLARALILELLALGKSKGAKIATLEVRASNEAAKKLYEEYGFTQIAV
ncbi:MAG: ribosomal protein S18-alanine N-acetyltransferase, partial [Candidatus Firestonebacteria bacterium]